MNQYDDTAGRMICVDESDAIMLAKMWREFTGKEEGW